MRPGLPVFVWLPKQIDFNQHPDRIFLGMRSPICPDERHWRRATRAERVLYERWEKSARKKAPSPKA